MKIRRMDCGCISSGAKSRWLTVAGASGISGRIGRAPTFGRLMSGQELDYGNRPSDYWTPAPNRRSRTVLLSSFDHDGVGLYAVIRRFKEHIDDAILRYD